jgi:long-chain fatty acid transport protein
MKNRTPISLAAALALTLGALPLAHATNGMLLEGYGPVATGMGGASTAFDNGLAAATNNPATLALMGSGARLDVAVGMLGPNVTSSAGPMSAKSGGTSYVMPAIGYGRRSGNLTYGLALFAQGGMGTEYAKDGILQDLGSGKPVRSELGVGRLIMPVAWKASQDLSIGGSIDFVWSTLDMRMALPIQALQSMSPVPTGSMQGLLPMLGNAQWLRIDFSDNSSFSGAAMGTGFAAKLGLLYKASPTLNLGASYHSQTHIGDMKTGASGASLGADIFPAPDKGRITVLNFQMPSEITLGAAWQANPNLLLAADLRHIGWASVMKDFRLRYETNGAGMVPDGSVSFTLHQNWKDQTVLHIGAAQRLSPEWTVRAGANIADNPIPEADVNPLFPATVKSHYTLGAGYTMASGNEINASMAYAPEVKVTNAQGIVVTHSQLNLQLMYSARF